MRPIDDFMIRQAWEALDTAGLIHEMLCDESISVSGRAEIANWWLKKSNLKDKVCSKPNS